MGEMEILDPSGHLSLTWDAANPESVAKAGAEFARLKEAGYTFFSTPDATESVKKLTKKVLLEHTALDVRAEEMPEQTREFKPHARRTVAVPRMRGG
jgi:hypothetical protein